MYPACMRKHNKWWGARLCVTDSCLCGEDRESQREGGGQSFWESSTHVCMQVSCQPHLRSSRCRRGGGAFVC